MNSVEAFKNELGNYNYYCNMLSRLEERLDETVYELEGVKGIRYDKAPSRPNMKLINARKHDLSDKIEKLENEISRISNQVFYIENVLSLMENQEVRKAIIDVYINNKTILQICEDYNLSNAGLHYQMSKEIRNALNQYNNI